MTALALSKTASLSAPRKTSQKCKKLFLLQNRFGKIRPQIQCDYCSIPCRWRATLSSALALAKRTEYC